MLATEASLQIVFVADSFDLPSFRLGAGALCDAARCAGFPIELSVLLPMAGGLGDVPFAATRDLRRARDLISTAEIQASG